MSRKPLIAGNWKMNLNHAEAVTLVQKLAWTLDDSNFDFTKTEVAVFPPFTDIRSVQTLIEGDKLSGALTITKVMNYALLRCRLLTPMI